MRYAEPKAFPFFLSRVEKEALPCSTAAAIVIGLLETIVHRQADLVERIQDEVESTAQGIFEIKGGQQTRNRRLDLLLKAIGKEGDITSRAQESAVSLDRVMTFFANAVRERNDDPRILQRIETVHRDIASLMEHMRSLTNRIMFLLDATLGMINIEQNQIIKIFSVLAVVLLPPTLVGTDLRHELQAHAGARMAARATHGRSVLMVALGDPAVRLFPPPRLAVTACVTNSPARGAPAPSAAQMASVVMMPRCSMNSSSDGQRRQRQRDPIQARRIGHIEPQGPAHVSVTLPKSTWSANQTVRLRMTPTTAAVTAASADCSRGAVRSRSM